MLPPRPWMTEEHHLFAESAFQFFEAELRPHIDAWRQAGVVERDFWRKAGGAGLLGPAMPEQFGGAGADVSFDAIVGMAQTRAGDANWGWSAHNIVLHYLLAYGTQSQQEQWMPGLVSGDLVAAIAMTEPDTGSDLQAIKTRAQRDGRDYVINGSKLYITNGQTADLIVVVCKTDPSGGARGVSLLVVEADAAPGFTRGRNLRKLGLDGADTSELFFSEVRVPGRNLLGEEEGRGFVQLMSQLPWERLMLAVLADASMESVIEDTLAFVKQRRAFGQRVMDFQNTRFKLAECRTRHNVTRAFVDNCMVALVQGELTAEEAAQAKWWACRTFNRVVDECLQLHGGAGLMLEYPIAHHYRDSRFARIVGGTEEIMKEIIARSMDSDDGHP